MTYSESATKRSTPKSSFRFFVLLVCAVSVIAVSSSLARSDTAQVMQLKTPDGGIQPQARLDPKGVLHLIYFKGKPMAGDIFYVRQQPGSSAFSPPLRVNSFPNSAVATGTIRGA